MVRSLDRTNKSFKRFGRAAAGSVLAVALMAGLAGCVTDVPPPIVAPPIYTAQAYPVPAPAYYYVPGYTYTSYPYYYAAPYPYPSYPAYYGPCCSSLSFSYFSSGGHDHHDDHHDHGGGHHH